MGLPRGDTLETAPDPMQWEGVRCPCGGQGQSPMVHRWGERDVTSADPAILLQQVASGAGAQEAALGVFAEEGTWRGDLAALVHI